VFRSLVHGNATGDTGVLAAPIGEGDLWAKGSITRLCGGGGGGEGGGGGGGEREREREGEGERGNGAGEGGTERGDGRV
jgi:hypothetical protein